MSASYALQVAIVSVLNEASVPFYDGAPEGRPYPSLTLGPSSILSDDDECIVAHQETVQIDVWDRSGGVMHPCKRLVNEVYDLLHDAALVLADPYAAGTCRVTLAQVFPDPDDLTIHGVVQVTVEVEKVG